MNAWCSFGCGCGSGYDFHPIDCGWSRRGYGCDYFLWPADRQLIFCAG